MPFLDHLEELRWRILWSVIALLVGTIAGFLIVQHFAVLGFLKQPIDQYLPNQRLAVTQPTDAFMITFKLSIGVGIILASPIILWQLWAFLSPALYAREKRYIVPVLLAGLLLFCGGVVVAYEYVLPAAMRVLFSFQTADLTPIITADAYFSFVIQLLLAFGLVFEVPLVMILLAMFGVLDPAFFAKNRGYAVVIASIAAAFLSPGPDVTSMVMMLIPLVALYEVGILVARLVWRAKSRARKAEHAAAILMLAALTLAHPRSVTAQGVPVVPPSRRDSTANRQGQQPAQGRGASGAVDTAAARKMGLPTGPSRGFPDPDSTIREMMRRAGYRVTRYVSDSVALDGKSKRVDFAGTVKTPAVVDREGSTLEAATIGFEQGQCRLGAQGEPKAFDKGTVLVGHAMSYDTCERRGTVYDALTNFNQSGKDWFLRADGMQNDSASVRIYAASSGITSSDEPLPEYHFATHEMKWVKNNILVARPAILYVRDVPVLWLPFMFEDMRQGRHTGMLVPRFGVNDLVRPNQGYHRHIANIGYYFALSDYFDAQASVDWFPENYTSVNGEFRYRWLDRFITGGLSISRHYEAGTDSLEGARSLSLRWHHEQNFDLKTSLSASVDYASSAKMVQRNTINPDLSLATLRSNVNFRKTFGFGTVNFGGSRSQDLSNGSVTQTLPSVSFTPVGVNFGESVTWSPSISFSNQRTFDQPAGGTLDGPPINGVAHSDSLLLNSRSTSFSLETPLRIGSWTWQNGVTVLDQISNARSQVVTVDSANPSRSVTTDYGVDFSTGVDWSTSINLPALFPQSWKLQPSVGIANATAGSFLLKNRYTNGEFVHQGKRATFGAQITPTFFGFFPGVGPVTRIRHSISPVVRYTYAPAADVPLAYARAINPTAPDSSTRSPAIQTVSFGLLQNFEGKLRPDPGDTNSDPARAPKLKLLSLQTSELQYDIEQAKLPGHTGWLTQSVNNTLTSDLLPGFSLTTAHDLWRGRAGSDTAVFDPFLTNVSARFSLSGRTLAGILALITGGTPPASGAPPPAPQPAQPGLSPLGAGPSTSLALDPNSIGRSVPRNEVSASISYDETRARPLVEGAGTGLGSTQSASLMLGFSPSPNWSVSWQTQYNITTGQFGEHVVRLERDLHRWRATFNFVKAPNGNFAFNFYISLLDQPDIKFNYQQQTIH